VRLERKFMRSPNESWGIPECDGKTHHSSYFFVCPKSSSDVSEILNDGVNEINEDLFHETYKQMDDNYNTPDSKPKLYVVRSVFSKEIEYKSWNLCVSQQDRFFLLPKDIKLTTRTGWIYSIARNYSNGKKEQTEELFGELCDIVVEKMSVLGVGKWYSLDRIFNTIIKHLQSKRLSPNRSQVISNNEWTSRYVISDDPVLTLQKINMPKTNTSHPFPMEWLVEKFAGGITTGRTYLPLLANVAHRPNSQKATIIDFLSTDENELRRLMLNSSPNIINDCLLEIGYKHTFLEPLPPDRRTKLFNLSFGYHTPRIPYFQHFTNISLGWDKERLWGDLELRLSEVFDMWIESLVEINQLKNRKELMEILNEGNTVKPFVLSEPVNIGSINIFIDAHQKCMDVNSEYGENIRKRLPKRMYQLMDPQSRQMLEYLSIARNHLHAQPRNKNPIQYDQDTMELWANILPNGGIDNKIRQCLQMFYSRFYGIDESTKVSTVPTLMEVVAFSETHRGVRAILHCMRNGTEHTLSLTVGRSIISYMDKKRKKTRYKMKLNLGDRIYVWATTNPTLVDPLIVKF